MSLLQLCKRSAAAQHVDHIYARHPTLNRAPYRLSATGSAGADHTNPRSWTGDVLVANVDIKTAWLKGRESAIHVLSRAGMNFDFDLTVKAFPEKSIDLMRPFGEYIGLQEDWIKASEHDQALQGSEGLTCTGGSATACSNANLATEANDIKLDDTKPTPSKKGWIDVEGQPVHLQSVAKVLFSHDGAQKSTDRLRRVRGYSKDPSQDACGKWSAPTLGDDLLVGNPALAFVCTGSGFALAVIQVSAIILGNGKHAQGVAQDDLSQLSVTIKGQIMALNEAGDGEWHWNGLWAMLNPIRKTRNDTQDIGILSVSKQATLMETKGCLIRPILGTKCDSVDRPVWCFSQAHMQDLSDELWESNKSHIGLIPQLSECNLFPYTSRNGTLCFIRQHEGVTSSESPKLNTQVACYLCSQHIKLKSMRTHVAQHIVASRYSIKENKYKFPIGELPCGFCGRSGDPSCTVSRIKPGTRYETSSGCRYYVRFTIPTYAQPSAATPTTNRPIPCELCIRLSDTKEVDDSKLFWSYNMYEHIARSHPDEVHRLPPFFQRSFNISDKELSYLLPDTFSGPSTTQNAGSTVSAHPTEPKTPTKREQNAEGEEIKKRLRVTQ